MVELGLEVAHGQWTELQMIHSSTWRELKAVNLVLRSFTDTLAGHAVKWFQITKTLFALCMLGVGNLISRKGWGDEYF